MVWMNLSALWMKFGPALGNHLWQSTLFAVAAALLTLAFRKNHARARYWLWLVASAKFLIPFSPLIRLGSRLAWTRTTAAPSSALSFAMERVGQPLAEPVVPMMSRAAVPASPGAIHLLPALLAVWLFGMLAVLAACCVRWWRISASIRQAAPMREGREMEALRRAEEMTIPGRRIEMFLSPTSLEPGILGIARPVLVWPQGISQRLDDAHLEAILTHELWHVRRQDNLAAAMHMLVEAIFWFHPLVWWVGAQMLAERERACDEAVLEAGSAKQVYAESILKICEFCVGSPLACVSGMTGADLKRRIHRIMSNQVASKLDIRRQLLLAAAAVLAVSAPIVAGAFHATPTRHAARAQNTTTAMRAFASVSITPSKSGAFRVMLAWGPNSFRSKNLPLQQVIGAAYGVEDDRIVGAPDWLNSEKYDLDAWEDSSGDRDPRKLSFDQNLSEGKLMLQQALADRLKLTLHRETRDLSVYALVLANSGPKLQEAKLGDTYPNGFKGPDGVARPGGIHFEGGIHSQDGNNYFDGGSKLVAQGIPVGALLFHLQVFLNRTITDETGLSGTYDFTFQVPPLPPIEASRRMRILSTALEQDLGLTLEPRTVPMEVLVIDHVQKPAEN